MISGWPPQLCPCHFLTTPALVHCFLPLAVCPLSLPLVPCLFPKITLVPHPLSLVPSPLPRQLALALVIFPSQRASCLLSEMCYVILCYVRALLTPAIRPLSLASSYWCACASAARQQIKFSNKNACTQHAAMYHVMLCYVT